MSQRCYLFIFTESFFFSIFIGTRQIIISLGYLDRHFVQLLNENLLDNESKRLTQAIKIPLIMKIVVK